MNELINVKVENTNGVLVTTSNRMAEELGVEHKNLLRKIDEYVNKFGSAESSAQFYIPSEYKSLDGRSVRNYLITEKGIAQLVGGYSSAVPKAFAINVAYINEFERMRKMLKEPSITFEQTIAIANVIRKTPVSSMEYVFKVLKLFVPELEMPEDESEIKRVQGAKVVKNALEFQKQLKQYLKENNLTICDFAKKNSLAKSNVWNWVSGKVTPFMPNLQIIANIIGSDVDVFL